jgi:hypothetical protein
MVQPQQRGKSPAIQGRLEGLAFRFKMLLHPKDSEGSDSSSSSHNNGKNNNIIS